MTLHTSALFKKRKTSLQVVTQFRATRSTQTTSRRIGFRDFKLLRREIVAWFVIFNIYLSKVLQHMYSHTCKLFSWLAKVWTNLKLQANL